MGFSVFEPSIAYQKKRVIRDYIVASIALLVKNIKKSKVLGELLGKN